MKAVIPQYSPMLVSAGHPFAPDAVFEPKWDGWRAIVTCAPGSLTVRTRTGRDITSALPELAPLGDTLCGREVVLDGELVLDGTGRSFPALAGRMARRTPGGPTVSFVAFDCLWLEGPLLDAPWHRRREALEDLELAGAAWCTTPAYDDLAALWTTVCQLELEGIVAKSRSAPYRPGVRSRDWVKHKTARWRRAHGAARHRTHR